MPRARNLTRILTRNRARHVPGHASNQSTRDSRSSRFCRLPCPNAGRPGLSAGFQTGPGRDPGRSPLLSGARRQRCGMLGRSFRNLAGKLLPLTP